MIDMLKILVTGLIDWLSGLLKTKNTSEAGLTESTGSGSPKSNNGSTGINWNTIILFIIFGVAMYLIPSPLQRTIQITTPVPVEVLVPGKPDTIPLPHIIYVGKDSVQKVQEIKAPQMVEVITDKDRKDAHIYIRTSAYPTIQNDSLHIEMWQEYNVQVKPVQIVRVDTIKVPAVIMEEVDVPFYEKPSFIIPTTAAVTAGVIYLILRAVK